MDTRPPSRSTDRRLRLTAKRLALCAGLFLAGMCGAFWPVEGNSTGAQAAFTTAWRSAAPLLVRASPSVRNLSQVTTRFYIPAEVAPRPGRWLILGATVEAGLATDARPEATAEVGVLTNGYEDALLDFQPGPFAGSLGTWWSTYELFTGSASGFVLGPTATLHLANYLQVRGAHAGWNTLSLRLTSFGGESVQWARLLSGLRIAFGPLGPGAPRALASVSATSIQVGQQVVLRYAISTVGLPVRDAGIAVTVAPPGLILLDTPGRYWGWTVRRRGAVHLEGLVPGRYRVVLTVTGGRGTLIVQEKTIVVRPAA